MDPGTGVEFTDDEIREELAHLGYHNVPEEKLVEFKRDLLKLIHSERSKGNSMNNSNSEDDSNYIPATNSDAAVKTDFPSTHNGREWRENWEYEGRAKSAPSTYQKRQTVPGHYSLFELPMDAGRGNANNCFKDDVSETDSERRFMKRKTSRKNENGNRMIDESFTESDTCGGIFDVYERIKNIAMRDCECGKSRPTSAQTEPPYRIYGENKNPSVIKKGQPPHSKNFVKTVPFKRHQMYEKMWKTQPAIGDNNHDRLRKAVHAKMLQKDEVKVDHKIYIPNQFVPPPQKPRYELRWQVRKMNANYQMPPHGFYHET